VKMSEARNYLMKLAEVKETQRKKDLAFWDSIIESLQMMPRTNIVDGLLKCCANRRAIFTDAISTGCAPEVTFYGAMLEETRKYKGLTDDEMVKIAIAGNKPAPIVVPPTSPAPTPVPPKAVVAAKTPIAGEVDDVSDMDDDEVLDKDDKPEVDPI
jgi:hypothetical protein